jgi:hypothetical protein
MSDENTQAAPSHGHPHWRRWTAHGIVVLASLLLALGVAAVWVKRVALDTPTWTTTSSQVLANNDVRTALSSYIVDQIYANVDVSAELASVLPSQAKPLAGAIATELRGYAQTGVARALETPAIQALWRTANEQVHEQLIKFVDGGGSRLQTTNGDVVLNLKPLLDNIGGRLGTNRVNAIFGSDAGRIVLIHSNQLKTASQAARVLRTLSYILIFVVLLLFALAVWLSPDRRREVLWCSIGVLAAGLLLIAVRRIAGNAVIDQIVPAGDLRPAASATWWIATEKLGESIQAMIVVGLLGLVWVWLASMRRRPTRIRRWLRPHLEERYAAYAVLALVVLLLVAWGPVVATRTFSTMLGLTIVAVIAIEALRYIAIRDATEHAVEHDAATSLPASPG